MTRSVMLAPPVGTTAAADKSASGSFVSIGISCASCPHNVPGHMGQRQCDLSGAQIWPHEVKPPELEGVDEALANLRDEKRPVHRHGLDMDRLRCPQCLPTGEGRYMAPAQVTGVLVVAERRGKLKDLLAAYTDAEQTYLRSLLAAWHTANPTYRELRRARAA